MEKVVELVGSTQHNHDGSFNDYTQKVEFTGELLNEYKDSSDSRGYRGTRERLYRTEDGRLIVATMEWSRWQGEGDGFSIVEVTPEDLGPDGPYRFVVEGTEYGRPLTLDEALNS